MIRKHPLRAKDFTHEKGGRHQSLTDAYSAKIFTKYKVRARVGHPFLVLKRVFGFDRIRSRPGQEHQLAVCARWAGQALHGMEASVASNLGSIRLKFTDGAEYRVDRRNIGSYRTGLRYFLTEFRDSQKNASRSISKYEQTRRSLSTLEYGKRGTQETQ